MAFQADVILRGCASGFDKGFAFRDQDLGADDVDARDFLCHRMLHLHTRIDFDEVESAAFHIHQEFDSTGAFIVHMGADFLAEVAQFFALRRRQIGGRRTLHHFLVAPLHRAIALPQVVHLAVLVAEDLHLHMAGAQDHLFEITFAIAKGGFGFAPAFPNFLFQFIGPLDGAHAASAAAP